MTRNARRSGTRVRGARGLGRIALSCDLLCDDPSAFRGTIWMLELPTVMCSRFRGTALVARRTPERLGDSYDGLLQLGFLLSGEARMTQRHQTRIIAPGEATTLLLDEPFESVLGNLTDMVQVYLPMDYLALRGIDTTDLAGLGWANSPLVDMVSGVVKRLTTLSAQDLSSTAEHVERALLEMSIGVLVEATGPVEVPDRVGESTRLRILEHIQDNYTDPTLDAHAIARTLRLNRRHVHRLFEGQPVSISSLIRSRRLDHAERMLLGPAGPTMEELARRSGFAGADQLARAFSRRYGMPPSRFRAQARRRLDDPPQTSGS